MNAQSSALPNYFTTVYCFPRSHGDLHLSRAHGTGCCEGVTLQPRSSDHPGSFDLAALASQHLHGFHSGSQEACVSSNTLPVPQPEGRGEKGQEGSCLSFSMFGLEFAHITSADIPLAESSCKGVWEYGLHLGCHMPC